MSGDGGKSGGYMVAASIESVGSGGGGGCMTLVVAVAIVVKVV